MARTLFQKAVFQWRRCRRLFCLLVAFLLHWCQKESSRLFHKEVHDGAGDFQMKLMKEDCSYVTVEIKEVEKLPLVHVKEYCSHTLPKKRNYVDESLYPTIDPTFSSNKKLLVLDINGVLADILSHAPKGQKSGKRISERGVFRRPFCHDFLKFCFTRYNVGIWSSRSKKNVDRMVDYLMGDLKERLQFCWNSSNCTKTKFSTPENKHKPLVLKELKNIWECSEFIWEKGHYNAANTLLLDDSPYKALLNPLHTAVFPQSYYFQDANDNSLGYGGDLRLYLEELSGADNVQKFVEQDPFGQRAIDESNELWSFYVKVVESFSTSGQLSFLIHALFLLSPGPLEVNWGLWNSVVQTLRSAIVINFAISLCIKIASYIKGY